MTDIKNLLKTLNEAVEEIKESEDNDDVKEIKDIIPILRGYQSHLEDWQAMEPEEFANKGFEKVLKAIDIVVDAIDELA